MRESSMREIAEGNILKTRLSFLQVSELRAQQTPQCLDDVKLLVILGTADGNGRGDVDSGMTSGQALCC
jgi:hypothetical protein